MPNRFDDDYDDFENLDGFNIFDDYMLSEPDFIGLDLDEYAAETPDIMLDVPYVPTDEKMVDAMLALAEVSSQDVLYDLGCGDGRINIQAALEYGTRGIGIDKDPNRVAEAMEAAGEAGVEYLVNFFEDDLFTIDLHEATVVTIYLLDSVNLEIRERLLSELQPGTRVVSHVFGMGDWKADVKRQFSHATIYLWVIPAQVGYVWEWQSVQGDTYRVALEQRFQKIKGQAWVNGKKAILTRALLKGSLIELAIQQDKETPVMSFVMQASKDQLLPLNPKIQATPAVKVKS